MKTNATHTPGPWSVRLYGSTYGGRRFKGYAVDAGENVVAFCEAKGIKTFTTSAAMARCEANARLIAAAPELLGALELAHEALGESPGYGQSTTATKIRAAIRKARGDA